VPYLSLSVDLEGRDPQGAEDACFEAGALSVTLTDAVDDAILEPAPGELRLWPRTVLQAIFDVDVDGSAAILQLARSLDLPADRIRVARIEDKVWEREWLKDFHAMRFGRRLWIVPRHEPPPDDADAVVVRLDPGLAFGTGTHPSTALCLTWLDAHLAAGQAVIDYGCGSGVLALAAARLGAARIHCYDLDPQAAIATRDNAAANAVTAVIELHQEPDTLPADADVLLANIISGTLCDLAPRFRQMLRPGARLVLAGILDEQAASVIAAYSPWIRLAPFGQRDGWTGLAGLRTQA
jgi:ribosomal protein L11 methyltransferase